MILLSVKCLGGLQHIPRAALLLLIIPMPIEPSAHGTKMRPHGSQSLFCDKLERLTSGKLYACLVGGFWRATFKELLALQEARRGTEDCLQIYCQAVSLLHSSPPSWGVTLHILNTSLP